MLSPPAAPPQVRCRPLPLGKLEQIEKLEQLRALENGYPIAIEVTNDPSVGVDTPEDAKRFELALEAK